MADLKSSGDNKTPLTLKKDLGTRPHSLTLILGSSSPVMRTLRCLILALVIVLGFVQFSLVIKSLVAPYFSLKDIAQEYLMAKALIAGVNPYLPIPELFEKFIGPLSVPLLPHPTPHPPPAALLGLPLALLAYEQAVVAWLAFEVVLIFAATYLLLVWCNGKPTFLAVLIGGGAFLAWRACLDELIVAQLMLLLLVLLLGVGIMLRSRRPVLAGLFLGVAIALKLMAWPIGLFLLLKREWKALWVAGAVVVLANGLVAILGGFDLLRFYYLEVSRIVSSLYRYQAYNFSMGAVGWRLFEGTSSPFIVTIAAPPLVYAPSAARLLSYGLPLAVLLLSLWLTTRLHDFELSFAMMVCTSVLISPVVWSHYFVLLLIPALLAWQRLARAQFPKKWTNWALVLGILFCIPNPEWQKLILWISGQEAIPGQPSSVSFPAAMITFIPMLAVLGLLYLLWNLRDVGLEQAER